MNVRSLLLGGVVLILTAAGPSAYRASEPGTGDWPMWGGTPDRNMVSSMKGLPGEWDIKTKKNVKWVAKLGSQSYGNPVVAGGMVFAGTNNELLRDPKQPGDRGVLMAFRESDGEFLWQHTHAKLESGRANDWPYQGIASSPIVEGKRLYYVSNRGVVFCVDIDGFRDNNENDGPYKDEKLTGPNDADVIWSFDMMEAVGSYPHNLSNSSPVIWNDRIFISTSNGQDESHVHVPSPRAPAIIALGKTNGDLLWEDNSVEDRILHGQWSTPAVGTIGGVVQVVSAQGDGWIRGYDTAGKKLWEFDTNPKDSVWPRTRNEVIATPVIYKDRVYLANGQDPEHGEGVGHMYAIDATKRGDITTSGRVWHFDKIRRSISTAAIADDLLYIADFSGFLHCLDATTGQVYWVHDVLAAVWASPFVADGKVYLTDEDGDVVVLQHGKEKKILHEMNMGSAVYGTPVPAHGTLFLNNRNELYALAVK